jgi:hypothetical protein
MNTITSSEQLLARPIHQRQTLVIVPDQDLRGIEQLASTQPTEQVAIEQGASTEQVAKWLELAVGLGSAVDVSKAVGVAVDRARQVASAGASRMAASVPALVPLAVGAVAVGAVAILFKSRNDTPVNVIFVSATAARGLTFSEGPFELGGVYTAHPMQHERYLPAASFHRKILEERTRETETFLLTCCGASKVEMTIDHGDNLEFVANARYEERPTATSGKLNATRVESTNRHAIILAPGRPAPGPLAPSEWIWFAAEPEWPEIHRQRRDAGITSYNLTTVVKDDRSVDFKALAKLPGVKLNADFAVKSHDKTVVTWEVSFPAV